MYGVFLIVQDGGGAILNFYNFKFLTVGGVRELNCVVLPDLIEIDQSTAEISAIFDLLCAYSDHSRKVFGGLYRCAKFSYNRCSSFENMHVFRFCEFGLKTPIHAPKIGVLGELNPLNGEPYQRNPKGTSLRESVLFEPSRAKIRRRV